MSCTLERGFTVQKGETWHPTIRWGTGVPTTKAITGIASAAPALVTAAGHGLPSGWPAAVVGVQGMTQINATRYPPSGADIHDTAVIDANTVALLDVSSTNFSAYIGGGYLVYDTPQSLSGVACTLTIYDTPDHSGNVLATLSSGTGITLDDTGKTIKPLLQTAGLTWTQGYYTLMATDGAGVVTELIKGAITIQA